MSISNGPQDSNQIRLDIKESLRKLGVSTILIPDLNEEELLNLEFLDTAINVM
jgi:hypothetical protein